MVIASHTTPRRNFSRLQVIWQEIALYNHLTATIRSSLTDLADCLQGRRSLSCDDEATYRAIAMDCVPPSWAAASCPSLRRLARYVDDLWERFAVLRQWCALFWELGVSLRSKWLWHALLKLILKRLQ